MGKLRRNYGESLEAFGMRSRREKERRNQFKKLDQSTDQGDSKQKKRE